MTDIKLPKPNYVEMHNADEVTLHCRDLSKTGSKQLFTFSAKCGQHRAGDHFQRLEYSGDYRTGHTLNTYMIEKITEHD